MRFGTRTFTRSLQSRVRLACRKRPGSGYSNWRIFWSKRLIHTPPVVRFGVVGLGIGLGWPLRDHVELIAGLAGWWWFFLVLMESAKLFGAMNSGPAQVHAFVYPLDHGLQWNVVRRRLIAAWTVAAIEFAVGFAVLGPPLRELAGGFSLLGFACAQAGVLLALVFLAQRWLPAQKVAGWCWLSCVALGITGIAGGFVGGYQPGFAWRFLAPLAEIGTVLFPGGWLANRFLENSPGASDPVGMWVGLAGVACVFMYLTARGLRDRMISAFERQDELLYSGESDEPEADEAPAAPATFPVTPELRQEVFRTVHERLESRGPMPGTFGRLVQSRLNNRDADLARINWAELPSPSTRWIMMTACLAAPLIGRAVMPSGDGIVEVVAGIILWLTAVPLAIDGWRAFRPVAAGAKLGGWFAFFPLTYWRLSWVVMRVDFLRVAANAPWLAAFALVSLWHSPWGLGEHLSILFLAWGAAIAAQPLRVIIAFSRNSCDSNRFLLVLAGMGMLILWIAAAVGAIVLAAGGPHGGLLGAVTIAIGSLLTWALYGWLFSQISWDLIRVPST